MQPAQALPRLTSAMEDYLEAIYHLEKERRIARVRDIAGRLGVKMSSVSSALKTLSSRGLIRYDPHQYIILTDRGVEKAKEIVRRHEVLKRFLSRVLKLEDSVAEDNACRMEHHLDLEVIDKLVGFVEFVEMCPLDQTRWLEGLSEGCEDCVPCLDQARRKVRNRAKAQRLALEEGMTLAAVEQDSQVMIESIKGSAAFHKALARDAVKEGAIATVEEIDSRAGTLRLNIKGYHVSLNKADASKILVKPI